MKKELSLAKIGSRLDINLRRINENIPIELKNQLSKHPYGEVVGYKITDGVELGLILKLTNGERFWFFEREINSTTYNSNSKIAPYESNVGIEVYNYSSSLYDVLNPFKFIKWLKISFKDVT